MKKAHEKKREIAKKMKSKFMESYREKNQARHMAREAHSLAKELHPSLRRV